MPAAQRPRSRRHRRTLAVTAALAAVATAAGPAAPGYAASTAPAVQSQSQSQSKPASRTGAVRVISYAGYRFTVPRSWPVTRLDRHPRTCVRFDRHVVYLGPASANQDCKANAVGATEAIQIGPGPARSARRAWVDPVASRITATAPRIAINATYSADPAAVRLILASAGLPAPVRREPHPVRLPAPGVPGALQSARTAPPARPRPHSGNPKALQGRAVPDIARFPAVSPPVLPANVSNFRGLGFDACTAPSHGHMRAWRRHSPYRAVGIYIGGSKRACLQPNLTTRWLRAQAADGWRFFPMYVGPQAQYHQLYRPRRQATAAASDAVADAERLGFGPRTPIYYDMENFPPRETRRALRFFSAWTRRLHYLGFRSGIYSSSSSGIAQLARHYRHRRYVMPDVVYDALWNGRRNTRDSVFGRGQWSGRRVHQFHGGVTLRFGGKAITVDKDFLNVALPQPGGSGQSSRAASQPDGRVDVFYRGAGGRLNYSEVTPGGTQDAPARLPGRLTGQPAAVTPVPGSTEVFYRGAGGRLWVQSRPPGRGWSRPRQLTRMGEIGGSPAAVAQPNGVVDVFWKGAYDDHLWHAQYSPDRGWRGPQRLGGDLASAPSPAESYAGTVQVFWKGTDKALWHIVRRPGRNWTKPVSLGKGPLGGAPQASGAANGTIGVFWHGAGNHILWGTTHRPGHPWIGPFQLGGDLRSAPAPLLSPDGQAHVFWRGRDGQLWYAVRGPRGIWYRARPAGISRVGSEPAVAAGPSGRLAVFWRGRGGHLWFTSQSGGTDWDAPRNLGGRVA
jgi:hypothetical protein